MTEELFTNSAKYNTGSRKPYNSSENNICMREKCYYMEVKGIYIREEGAYMSLKKYLHPIKAY
jgi:hypothetical protein